MCPRAGGYPCKNDPEALTMLRKATTKGNQNAAKQRYQNDTVVSTAKEVAEQTGVGEATVVQGEIISLRKAQPSK
jgi:hypothetical protein